MPRRPILPIISLVMLVGVMFLLSVHTLTSIYQDIGRHIRLGGIIWSTHQVPRTNLFSYTAPDFPFINHHWLGEVLLYLGDRAVGLAGLVAIKAVLVAAAFGLALAAVWRSRLALPALVVGFVSMLILVERTDVRPEILSFIFLSWYLFVLYRLAPLEAGRPGRPWALTVWTLPVIQLLWVNSHIYFFMGPFIFGAFVIQNLLENPKPKIRNSKFVLLILSLIALATLCNPWGLTGALYPFHIFGNYGYSIVENQTPFFLAGFGYPALTSYALYMGIIMIVGSFILNWRNIRHNVFGLLLATATAAMALMMIRNFPLFALVMLPVILKNLDEVQPVRGEPASNGPGLVIAMILLLLFGASVVTGQFFRDASLGRQFGLIVPAGPQEPVDFFRQADLKGPIFNNFDIGSFLIWRLPEEPVFIDGRPEAYPADFVQNVYIKMQQDPAVWKTQSEKYHLNTIIWGYNDITPWSQIFVPRILQDPQWVLVYRDYGIIILVRNVPENREVIAKYRIQ